MKYHDNLNIIICINQYLLQFYDFDILLPNHTDLILSCLDWVLQARAYKNSSVHAEHQLLILMAVEVTCDKDNNFGPWIIKTINSSDTE